MRFDWKDAKPYPLELEVVEIGELPSFFANQVESNDTLISENIEISDDITQYPL